MVSAYVMQVACQVFAYQLSAIVMQVRYHLLCISLDTNGLCVCEAGSL